MEVRTGVHPLSVLIDKVFLDGVEQRGVQAIDALGGQLERGKRFKDGEEPGPEFIAVGKSRYIFDRTVGDFVLETVRGRVEVTWKDRGTAERSLRLFATKAA